MNTLGGRRFASAIRSQLGGTAADVHHAHAASASHVALVECVFSQSTGGGEGAGDSQKALYTDCGHEAFGHPWLIMSAPWLCRQTRHREPLSHNPGQSLMNVSLHRFERGTLAKSERACRAGSLGSPGTVVLVSPTFFLQVPPAAHNGKSCGQQCEWSAQQEAFVAAQQPQKPTTHHADNQKSHIGFPVRSGPGGLGFTVEHLAQRSEGRVHRIEPNYGGASWTLHSWAAGCPSVTAVAPRCIALDSPSSCLCAHCE